MANFTTSSTEIASKHFLPGDVVKIVFDAIWANGNDVPRWVIDQEWIVSHSSESNPYVVIDKSVDGKYSIKSSIKYTYLTLVRSSGNLEKESYEGMKYSPENPPMVCMATNSSCYNGTTVGTPVGVLWHSTGANNPNLKRYVQPSYDDPNREQLLKIIGKNNNGNDWNNKPIQAGLNAWIGKLANGEVTSVQTLPWNYRAWGCGSGSNGSCNGSSRVTNSPFWLQFEICEDNLNRKQYFDAVYREAVELTAYWCKMFNFDPHGTVEYNGVKVPVILDHATSHKLGLGSNHGDVEHWFKKYGKTMSNVRDDVKNLLKNSSNHFIDVEESDWFYDAVQYVYKNGIMNGTGSNTFDPDGVTTRAMIVSTLYRIAGSPDTNGMKSPFKDVASGSWYEKPVIWAYNNKIASGTSESTFEPDTPVTREQVATFLFRYAKEDVEGADISKYPDASEVSDYAKAAVSWAVKKGIINGTTKNNVSYLDPKGQATRAQTAAILSRYVK